MAERKPRKKQMSAEHKAALAVGRTESRVVKAYLDALEAHKPKRGRKRTPDSIERRLQTIEDQLPDADPLTRVHLVQEQMDLHNELASMQAGIDLSELEAEFVEVANSYSERRGVTYAAWRAVGVEARVLKAAGISRAAR